MEDWESSKSKKPSSKSCTVRGGKRPALQQRLRERLGPSTIYYRVPKQSRAGKGTSRDEQRESAQSRGKTGKAQVNETTIFFKPPSRSPGEGQGGKLTRPTTRGT